MKTKTTCGFQRYAILAQRLRSQERFYFGVIPISSFHSFSVFQFFTHRQFFSLIDYLNYDPFIECGQMAAHITKKALCTGKRGHKDLKKDIQEIIDTAHRWLEMIEEDEE